jgi:hypothetical protein
LVAFETVTVELVTESVLVAAVVVDVDSLGWSFGKPEQLADGLEVALVEEFNLLTASSDTSMKAPVVF